MASKWTLALAACVALGACGSGKGGRDASAPTDAGTATVVRTAPGGPVDPRLAERSVVRREVVRTASSAPVPSVRIDGASRDTGLSRMVGDAIASVPRQHQAEAFRLVACRSAEMDPVRASRERARMIREAGADAAKGVRATC